MIERHLGARAAIRAAMNSPTLRKYAFEALRRQDAEQQRGLLSLSKVSDGRAPPSISEASRLRSRLQVARNGFSMDDGCASIGYEARSNK